jgi:RND family efflux transporter MFP subunit
MKRIYIIVIIIVTTIFIYGCASSANKEEQSHKSHEQNDNHEEHPEIIGLQTEILTAGTFTQVIRTSGEIRTPQGDEVTIVSTINGIVTFSNPSISDGVAIKSGETAVTISAKNLPEGDPNAKLKIEYELAAKEYNRAEELVKDKIISAKEFEQAKSRYLTAKTAYEAQSSQMTDNGSVKITSPISGFVKNRYVNQGEYVVVGQPIIKITQNKRLQLRAEVSEKHFKDLKYIACANFKPAYEDTLYKLSDLNGRLLSFGKTSGQQSFYIPVIFEFDNVGDIIAGSFIDVYLLSAVRENALTVPVSAITEEQGVYFVYLQSDEGEFEKKEVALGPDDGERALVLSGLNVGDRIVSKEAYRVKLATSTAMPEGHNHSH